MQDGKRIQSSLETTNKKRAEKRLVKVLTEIQDGRWLEFQISKRPLKEMLDRYLKEYTVESVAKGYWYTGKVTTLFKHFYDFLGYDATLGTVEERIGEYETHRKLEGAKNNTIIAELSLLRRVFNIARKQWKWKFANPLSSIEFPKPGNGRVRYLTPDEYKRLMDALDNLKPKDKWLKPVIIIALETGLRLGNIAGLLWMEVNLANRMIVIDADKMKNDDYIGLPLTDEALSVLSEFEKIRTSEYVLHSGDVRRFYRKVSNTFRKLLKAAEITNFHFHDLRHTFASLHAQSGTDIYTLQKLMGHKDGRMTRRYAHLSVASLKKAVAKLNGSVTNLLHGQDSESGAVV